MKNYIVNHSIKGFETVDIKSELLKSEKCNVVIVLNSKTEDNIHDYYNKVIDIIRMGSKIILIIVGKESKIRKTIAMLMATYREYGIYKVDSVDTITEDYLQVVMNRTPSVMEVQQYIGGDISAYSELNTILTGIKSLINSGDTDGMKVFIEQHIESIDSSIDVVEYMRKLADTANSGELTSIIEKLKVKVESSIKSYDEAKGEIKGLKDSNESLENIVATTKKELAKAITKSSELEEQITSNNGAPVITNYKEINTSLIKCKAQTVIYFKEISYVRYINSLVMTIVQILKFTKLRVKLIIYDSKNGMSGIYRPLSMIGSPEFMSNKTNFIVNTDQFVVVEPNPAILESVLTSVSPAFDLVIVYDRMRQLNDVVTGNNVTKIFVVNSQKNFDAMKDTLKIGSQSLVISGEPSIKDSMTIGDIEGYSTATDTAKMSKYKKLLSHNSEPIINTILTKARVDLNG